MNFLPNFYFILQIYHAKSFKMRHVTYLHFNFSVWYSWNALKIQYYYTDLIELQNAPLTYSLCNKPTLLLFQVGILLLQNRKTRKILWWPYIPLIKSELNLVMPFRATVMKTRLTFLSLVTWDFSTILITRLL